MPKVAQIATRRVVLLRDTIAGKNLHEALRFVVPKRLKLCGGSTKNFFAGSRSRATQI